MSTADFSSSISFPILDMVFLSLLLQDLWVQCFSAMTSMGMSKNRGERGIAIN